MNEMLDSQLSAMFDDELPAAECELLARRLARDEELQDRWKHFALIGAAVRGERGVALHINLRDRVRKVVEEEMTPAVPGIELPVPSKFFVRRVWQGLAGAGLAAGVAAMSVMWLRTHDPATGVALIAQAPVQQVPTATAASGADRYVVPVTVESTSLPPTAELANYVVAHSEYSGPLNRRNLLSALVASEAASPQGSVESQTAAPSKSSNEQGVEAANVQDAQ